ncbi:cell wall metabolism sensor histidine kinase WalK [bacterium]|nr:cell wall metabolism sensor histidine kinase WalK [bacterium]
MKLKIHTKLFLAFVLVILTSLLLFGIFVSPRFKQLIINQEKESLLEELNLINSLIKDIPPENWNESFMDAWVDKMAFNMKARLTVVDKEGRVIGDSFVDTDKLSALENHILRPEIKESLSMPYGFSMRYSETAKMNMLYVALKTDHGYIRLARSMDSVDETLLQMKGMVLFSYCVSFVLVGILAFFLSRSMSSLLKNMTRVSRQISKGDFTERLIKTNDDELGEMIDSINEMARRLDEQKHSISAEKNRLLTVLNAMMEGVVVVDTAKRILLMNPAGIRMLGAPENYHNKSLIESIRYPVLEGLIDKTLVSGNYHQEEVNLTIHKRDYVFVVHVSPLLADNEQPGVVMVLYDVSEHQKLENMRREFVANVSHELKTPLTSILGYAETLQDGAHQDEKTRLSFMDKIVRNANHLKELVDDILELSRIESGKDEYHIQKIELKKFMEDLLQLYKEKAAQRKITFKLSLDNTVSHLHTDPQSLRQILGNLIDNGIKYNREEGSLTITSHQKDGYIEIGVSDTGMGIPKEDAERVFERFFRVDKARSRQIEGTGLGLSIVKHLVTRLGGSVGVDSVISQGTRFYFTLPL